MGKRTHKFDMFSDDYFRVINRIGVRQRIGLCGIDYIRGDFDGPSASNILSSIAVSQDEKLVAVGGADRIFGIHIAELE